MKDEEINRMFADTKLPSRKVDRRDFLKRLGGGVIIVFSLSELAFISDAAEDELPDFNGYLRVKENGRVDCFSGKIEMGQGANTSLSQALAEELEVNIDQVDIIMGDTELCPYDAGTWGSMTTRFTDPKIREAAATARIVLIELASGKMGVSVDRLMASEGKVIVKTDRTKSITYAELTKGKKIVRSISTKPELKKPEDFKVIGKPHLRLDALDKVTGKALYTGDVRLPGMLFARIVRPPAHSAKLLSADTSAAEAMDGVRLLKDNDFIVALHPLPEVAEMAVNSIKAKWDVPASKADNESIFEHILKTAKKGTPRHEGGDLETGRKTSDLLFEQEYHDGYKAHASLETHVATAVFENGKLTMWASTQTPFGTRDAVAKELELEKEKVHIKQIFLGGGFGGKIYNQQAIECARIAKMIEATPVQLMWSRKEEFMYDWFRPAAVIKINSGVKKDGLITFWDFKAHCSGARGTNLFYKVPHHNTTTYDGKDVHPFNTGAWRAPGNSTNTFARESQIDIMAHKIGMDPAEFRLKNMNDEQAINSLKLAVKKYDWFNKTLPKGTGRGMAVGTDAGTLVTVIVELKVDIESGEIDVKKAVVGQDMGQVVNPEGASIQAEGCVNMGLGYALTEDIEFNWGEVQSVNFGDYKIPKFSTVPEVIDVAFADAMDKAPQGGGEPSIICMGAAVANAVFDACGARVFRLPITKERVLEALRKNNS